jgi:hypothetical protein
MSLSFPAARDFFLVYFGKDCHKQSMIRGAVPHASYKEKWKPLI